MQIVTARSHTSKAGLFGTTKTVIKAYRRGSTSVRAENASTFRRLGCRIIGSGSSVPEAVVSNRDLEGLVDTSDEWIRTRTGIRFDSCMQLPKYWYCFVHTTRTALARAPDSLPLELRRTEDQRVQCSAIDTPRAAIDTCFQAGRA